MTHTFSEKVDTPASKTRNGPNRQADGNYRGNRHYARQLFSAYPKTGLPEAGSRMSFAGRTSK
jgi:hypothetical protein